MRIVILAIRKKQVPLCIRPPIFHLHDSHSVAPVTISKSGGHCDLVPLQVGDAHSGQLTEGQKRPNDVGKHAPLMMSAARVKSVLNAVQLEGHRGAASAARGLGHVVGVGHYLPCADRELFRTIGVHDRSPPANRPCHHWAA